MDNIHSDTDICDKVLKNKSSQDVNLKDLSGKAPIAEEQDTSRDQEPNKNSYSGLYMFDKSLLSHAEEAVTLRNCENIRLNLHKFIKDLREDGHDKGISNLV